jgi:multidrug efflux pump subunit AcrB
MIQMPMGRKGDSQLDRFLQRFDGWLSRLGDKYDHAIQWALCHRSQTIGIAVLSLLLAIIVSMAWARSLFQSRT